jgi:hypothetical protein
MGQSKYAVAMAEQHVREAKERVARQAVIVERLEEAGHGWAANEAKKMLETVRTTLRIARSYRAIVRALVNHQNDA